jgi:2-polyprenyl-6-methoxyphenol hydroxylase-like FAD-dependent oxidoreductase
MPTNSDRASGLAVDRAVVVGGSVAGLAAALAVAPHASQVIVLERHDTTGEGSIVPQGRLPHVLLAGGAAALDRLAPGYTDELRRQGAVGADPGPRPVHWWAHGACRTHLPDVGIEAPLCTRTLVESTLRARVLTTAGIEPRRATVTGLEVTDGRVRGVRLDDSTTLAADVVVDASGRAARGAVWLADLGVKVPDRERVSVDVVYTAVEVERRPTDLDGGLVGVVQNSADVPRIGVALAAEGDRWQIVLGGYFGEHPDLDRDSMLAFAGSLPDPAIAHLLAGTWLSEPRRHRFPASERTRWSTVDLPTGFFVVGDAVASFNPIYGQGMSSAAQQAMALADCLAKPTSLARATRAHARAADRVAETPWRVATGADFIYAETEGRKPAGTDVINRYLERVMRVAPYDERVNRALTRVQLLLARPESLMAPAVVARTLFRSPSRRRAASVPSAGVEPTLR